MLISNYITNYIIKGMKEKLIGKFMGHDLFIKTDERVLDKAEQWFLEGSKKMTEIEVDPELSKLAGIKTKTIMVD
jgi:hypothetical protein